MANTIDAITAGEGNHTDFEKEESTLAPRGLLATFQEILHIRSDSTEDKAHKGGQKAPEIGGSITSTTKSLRYKYTNVTIDGSGIKEEARERPKRVSTPTISDGELIYELRFVTDKEERRPESRIEIVLIDPGLKRLIDKGGEGYFQHCGYDANWDNEEPLKFESFHLVHQWDRLREIATAAADQSDQYGESLNRLLDDIETHANPHANFKRLQGARMIDYDSLIHLFVPGGYIVAFPFFNLPQLFQIDDANYEGKSASYVLTTWTFDWIGEKLDRVQYEFRIEKFHDEKRITDLPFYPVRFYEDGSGDNGISALRKKLKYRAVLFRNLCSQEARMFRYQGDALVLDRTLDRFHRTLEDTLFGLIDEKKLRESMFSLKFISEDVIIDPYCFTRYGYQYACIGDEMPVANSHAFDCKFCDTKARADWMRSFTNDVDHTEHVLSPNRFDETSDQWLLLPARVLGFCLGLKFWAQFSVENLQGIDENDIGDLKEELVLPKDLDIEVLEKMFKYHSRSLSTATDRTMRDPISGKGDGLILLFHGPSGVGKTLTAEILAKTARLPLYKVGISDIGRTPREAEKGLRYLFDLAQRWKAILLIDEADVFLDARGTMGEAEMEKNAMVAVLLREIEYFSGILIMTTNRVLTFDVAMLSRINWPINFGHLSKDNEARIWKMWCEKWKRQNQENAKKMGKDAMKKVEKEEQECDSWKKTMERQRVGQKEGSTMNGREIRNIFMTASTMAEENEIVSWETIVNCYWNTVHFRSEMENIRTQAEVRSSVFRV
ncbi:hypothetical protein N0V90_010200 [Kalmusia sp. IMI 367209]|nr:hypothetical protein N0V90_010200 [Kalmusia sp. IMI 367209]